MLLADIGNTHFHILDEGEVYHLSYEEAIDRYQEKALYYISVKGALDERITQINRWRNISSQLKLDGAYETMGIDRRALCLSHEDGIFVDAGSAITVDVMHGGIYQGGFILPGLKTYLESYAKISSALDTSLNEQIDLTRLPTTTKDGISYGIIASIKALIDKHRTDQTLYFTGGDGAFLSRFFEDAQFDEMLVFKGMQNALRKNVEMKS
jgi:type III pantothenate kinase